MRRVLALQGPDVVTSAQRVVSTRREQDEMSVVTEKQRTAPPRLLAALRGVGVAEEEIRRHYRLGPDQVVPGYDGEPLRVEDMELVPDDGYRYELWEGRLVRMSAAKRRHGGAAGTLAQKLSVYIERQPIGKLYIAETGFQAGTGASLYCPDLAYVSAERDATVGPDEFFPFAPDIAIEVWSPDNTEDEMKTKATNYLAHGGTVVWLLRPQDRTVRVHRSGQPVQILRADDFLTEEDVLPGFSVRVGDLFPR